MTQNNSKKRVFFIAKRDRVIFDAIASGAKTIETRAATVRTARAKAGDIAVFICGRVDRIEKRIRSVRRFKTVLALLRAYPVSAIYPGKTPAELRALYSSFPGYEEKIKEVGILAFELE